MMPKKKKKILIITSIISVILIIIGILIYLYYTTDMFKSNNVLFYKYLANSFEIVNDFQTLEHQNDTYQILENNKYTSDIEGTIKYTSEDNTQNPINDLKLNINSQIDKENKFDYKQISIEQKNEGIFKIEYIKNDDLYGIRPNGINQFASAKYETLQSKSENISSAINQIQNLDIKEILSLTQEEMETIKNTYSNIIYQNIPVSSYGKQSGVVITVNETNLKTNAYFVTMTKEQFNNIYIAILEQLKQDEAMLAKLTKISRLSDELTSSQKQEIRDKWVNNIEKKIQEIKSNNIGQEQRNIIIYENKGKTVRIEIQTDEYTMTMDGMRDSNNAIIEINNIQKAENMEKENSNRIMLQKNIQEESEKYKFLIRSVKNGIDNNFELVIDRKNDEADNITKMAELKIYNEENEATINVTEKITIVNNFRNQIKLNDENNIEIEKLNEEQINTVMQTIQNNLTTQFAKVQEVIEQADIQSILVNLNLAEPKQEGIYDGSSTTAAERNRFNSQFEFCVGENIEKEKINRLIDIAKQNLDSIKITEYKEKKDEKDPLEPKQYKLIIKKDSSNEELAESLSKYIEESKENKFSVEIEYNQENGLVENIFITTED